MGSTWAARWVEWKAAQLVCAKVATSAEKTGAQWAATSVLLMAEQRASMEQMMACTMGLLTATNSVPLMAELRAGEMVVMKALPMVELWVGSMAARLAVDLGMMRAEMLGTSALMMALKKATMTAAKLESLMVVPMAHLMADLLDSKKVMLMALMTAVMLAHSELPMEVLMAGWLASTMAGMKAIRWVQWWAWPMNPSGGLLAQLSVGQLVEKTVEQMVDVTAALMAEAKAGTLAGMSDQRRVVASVVDWVAQMGDRRAGKRVDSRDWTTAVPLVVCSDAM